MLITFICVLVCVIVGILQVIGVMPYNDFAIIPQAVLEGEYYRVVTGSLMHASLYHLLGNMSAFVNMGIIIESVYGKIKYSLILLSSLIGSSLLVVLLNTKMTVGFSGVVFGVFGAFAIFMYKEDNYLDQGEKYILSRILIPNIIISLLPGVSWQGHLGGFVGGFIMGAILPLKRINLSGYKK